MVQHLIVPVDGSSASWNAFDVALRLAKRSNSSIRVVEVACDPVDGRYAQDRLTKEINERGPFDVDVTVEVRLMVERVSDELAKLASLNPTAVIVMSSHGKGRSAAIVGSVAEDLMHKAHGPVVLVGPHVVPSEFSGPMIVCVDGSPESEVSLPLAATWAGELKTTPWIVNVAAPGGPSSTSDVHPAAYPARLARDLASFSGHAVQFDELHSRSPAKAIVDYAEASDASMIVASSHGRSGLSRLAMGSVVAELVRHATCPVTVVRLPRPVRIEHQGTLNPAAC